MSKNAPNNQIDKVLTIENTMNLGNPWQRDSGIAKLNQNSPERERKIQLDKESKIKQSDPNTNDKKQEVQLAILNGERIENKDNKVSKGKDNPNHEDNVKKKFVSFLITESARI